ncbi:uncharacterized protein N7473_011082 [Penicillium subrubescens]|uniref:uncharacterized protein n=1 Tax=Penicillium subrubescens TaxID=1316194 RepID=UPI002544F88F|nr:uncharacterized protein N7473_011082 [Penicillium subrubescens]KAJ5882820.1 hypothetical protein N7473_011082 [Penicillium subrubescens]
MTYLLETSPQPILKRPLSQHLGPSLSEQSGERKDKKKRKKEKRRKATAEEPITEQPTAEEALAEEPAAPEPATQEYPAEEYPAPEPATEEYPAEEYPAPEPAAEEYPAEEYPAEEYPAEEYPAEEYPAPEPATEEYFAEEYPAPEPATEEHPVEEPAAEEPLLEKTFLEGNFAGLSAHNFLRIQVSAKHLTFASPVFKRLLAGSWKESVAFLQKGSVEIVADSWDIEALMILLRAIHGQHYHIPKKLTLEMLAKVAVIADYYECGETLCFLTDVWIEKLEEKIPAAASKDLVLWLWIAWFFRLPSQFKLSTSIAMSHSEGSIDSLELPIPKSVIVSINEGREKAIHNLILLLDETRDAFLLGTRGCRFECRSIMYGALTMQMQSNNLLSPEKKGPFPNLNYRSLVQGVKAFKSPEWYDSSSRYSSYGSSHVQRCAEASFASIFGGLEESLEGLELSRFTNQ